jgi:hypothetical protein
MPAPSPARGVGAHGAAVLEVAEDGERILDQLVGGAALDVGNEPTPQASFSSVGS